jgi:hypothetical protein
VNRTRPARCSCWTLTRCCANILRGELREQRPEAWRAAHRRLYELLCATTKDKAQPSCPRSKTGELHRIVDSVRLNRGVEVAMLTGDNQGTAKRIARSLGIDRVLADVLPGDKASKVKELQAQGKKVGPSAEPRASLPFWTSVFRLIGSVIRKAPDRASRLGYVAEQTGWMAQLSTFTHRAVLP